MLIDLDLNYNDAEALLRHCREYDVPRSGDAREDCRLADALEALAEAIELAQTQSVAG